ncbi:hypothetical protein [Streptomyces sp. RTd22]|uniref:hypothetical protein n=1 Tax=Streptomyces sp. RTd22 TaxID=1841249 RepID=UPI0007C4BC2E|nr:hypothetical protein [Streptomyces sp. RTd22]
MTAIRTYVAEENARHGERARMGAAGAGPARTGAARTGAATAGTRTAASGATGKRPAGSAA